jgi:hypothetical protein
MNAICKKCTIKVSSLFSLLLTVVIPGSQHGTGNVWLELLGHKTVEDVETTQTDCVARDIFHVGGCRGGVARLVPRAEAHESLDVRGVFEADGVGDCAVHVGQGDQIRL